MENRDRRNNSQAGASYRTDRPDMTKEPRRPKHFDILDALENLTAARLAVQGLCDEICGAKMRGVLEEEPQQPDVDPVVHCLLGVLDDSPDHIHREVQLIRGALDEIKAQIL